jgi:hypothetical protein
VVLSADQIPSLHGSGVIAANPQKITDRLDLPQQRAFLQDGDLHLSQGMFREPPEYLFTLVVHSVQIIDKRGSLVIQLSRGFRLKWGGTVTTTEYLCGSTSGKTAYEEQSRYRQRATTSSVDRTRSPPEDYPRHEQNNLIKGRYKSSTHHYAGSYPSIAALTSFGSEA